MDNFLEELKELIRLSGGMQKNAAALLQCEPSYISQLLGGKKVPSVDFVTNVHVVLEDIKSGKLKVPEPSNVRPYTGDFREVDVVTWTQAGAAFGFKESMAKEFDELVEFINSKVRTESKDDKAKGVIIQGDSMEPEYIAGDIVIFEPSKPPRHGYPAWVKLADGRTLFKYYYTAGEHGELVILQSGNPAYKDIILKREEIQAAYPACDFKRPIGRRDRRNIKTGPASLKSGDA